MEWKNGKLSKLIIKSLLGGNCRLRTFNNLKLQGEGMLKEARGKNPNSFFRTPENPAPIISEKADLTLPQLKPTFLYDLNTQAGKSYTLVRD